MLVALRLAGIDARDIDRAERARALGADLKSALEGFELALDRGDAQVLDVELDARMDWIDLPGALWERGCGCGGGAAGGAEVADIGSLFDDGTGTSHNGCWRNL